VGRFTNANDSGSTCAIIKANNKGNNKNNNNGKKAIEDGAADLIVAWTLG